MALPFLGEPVQERKKAPLEKFQGGYIALMTSEFTVSDRGVVIHQIPLLIQPFRAGPHRLDRIAAPQVQKVEAIVGIRLAT